MFDVNALIESGSILLLALIIFAESGLLIGFFLPGDTLLFGAGLAASQGKFSLATLIVAIVIAAIVGDNVGYSIGRRAGPRIFKKKDSILFKHEHLQRAEKFYETYGGLTIILARFTPMVRTFAPVVAGASKMPRQKFMFFNVFGGLLWGAGMPSLGYYVGDRIPYLNRYIEVVVMGVILVSFGLAIFHILREKGNRKRLADKFRQWGRILLLNKRVD